MYGTIPLGSKTAKNMKNANPVLDNTSYMWWMRELGRVILKTLPS